MARQTIKQVIEVHAKDLTKRALGSAKKRMTSFDRLLKRVHTTLLGFVGIHIAGNLIRDFTSLSDEAVNLNNKLKLVTSGAAELDGAMDSLVDTSLATGSSISANITLFSRMARPVKALGYSLQQTLDVTHLFAEGLRISGASAQETTSTIRQASQAFASGVLRGEEFNAIMENGGRLAIALADGMEVSIGSLRKMSKQGKLTADVVIDAWLSQSEVLARENKNMTITISQSIENIKSKFTQYLAAHQGGNKVVAEFFNGIATNFDKIAQVFIPAVLVGTLKLTSVTLRLAKVRLDSLLAAKAEAKEKQRIDAAALMSVKHQEAVEAQQALLRAKSTRAELVGSEARQQARVRELKATQLSLQSAIAYQRVAREGVVVDLQNARSKEARLVAMRTLNSMNASLIRSEAQLKVAITSTSAAYDKLHLDTLAVTGATQRLATANKVAAGSYAAVTAASKQSSLARLADFVGLGRLKGGFKSFGKVAAPVLNLVKGLISGVGRALTGWVGIAGYVFYEVTKGVIDYGVAWKSLKVGIEKTIERIVLLAKMLSHPFNATALKQDIDNYTQSIATIDDEMSKWSDNRLAEGEAQKKGFADAAEKARKDHEDNMRAQIDTSSKLAAKEQERLKLLEKIAKNVTKYAADEIDTLKQITNQKTQALEFEEVSEKEQLARRYTNADDFAVQVEALEKLTADAKTLVVLDGLKQQQAVWDKHYTDLEAKAANDDIALAKIQFDRNKQTQENLMQTADVHRRSIEEMSDHWRMLTNKALSYSEQSKSIVEDSEEYIASIRRQTMSDYEKQQQDNEVYRKALALARKADSLDELKDFNEINKLRGKSSELLKEYISATRSRASSAKEGSVEEISAQNEVNSALNAYKSNAESLAAVYAANGREFQLNADVELQRINDKRKALDTVIGKLDKISELVELQRTNVLDIDTSAANHALDGLLSKVEQLRANLANLEASPSAKKPVEFNADGGVAGNGATVGFVDANQERPRKYGKIGGSAQGGDTVPAMLQRGEFVLRKYAVSQIGTDFLQDINTRPQSFVNYAQNQNGLEAYFLQSGGYVDEPKKLPPVMKLRANNDFVSPSDGEYHIQRGKRDLVGDNYANNGGRASYTVKGEPSRGFSQDSRVNNSIDSFRDSMKEFQSVRSGGSTGVISHDGTYQFVATRVNKLAGMVEQLRSLPYQHTRDGLSTVWEMWGLNKGQAFSLEGLQKDNILNKKFYDSLKNASAKMRDQKLKEQAASQRNQPPKQVTKPSRTKRVQPPTPKAPTPVSTRGAGVAGGGGGATRTTRFNSDGSAVNVPAQPATLANMASRVNMATGTIARLVATSNQTVKSVSGVNNSVDRSNASVYIDLSADGRSVTGSFPKNEHTDALLVKLKQQSRVRIK